ncbi:TetR/AcrR family transcriptional regulator [Planomonospora sp. ID67723]|uniref:TetR/AcrR family transcriptional regulator n=1 Tax=Planomonospora sp. ID67723 TaxID=2738134 RepID=UPI0018C358BE|nr:TetR/AcrR family transcriptional regulator [Planomonospora sp. ID67723]MBG0830083.1 TetR/AcrR family transcriptional regulator [Planomonospora sp. ID67723]
MKTDPKPSPVRERLLATADALFYAEGIRAVGIDRVINDSQVSRSTMYVHFRTKEDLVAAYLRRRTDTWRAHVEAQVHARADDPAGRVLALFDVFHEQLSDPAYRGCPFVNAAAEYPRHEGIQAVIAYHRQWLPDLFGRLLEPPPADDALIAALVQLCDGAITTAHLDRDTRAAATARSTAALLLTAHGQGSAGDGGKGAPARGGLPGG